MVSLAPLGTALLESLGAADALVGRPATDLRGAAAFDPDLVLVDRVRAEDAPLASALRARGTEVVELAVHNFDDGFALCRRLGARLGHEADAERLVRRIALSLGEISSESLRRTRPLVAAVVGLEPLEVAGGHGFANDLIEIAGGNSVMHDRHQLRVTVRGSDLVAMAPDLVVVTSATELSQAERDAARATLPDVGALGFVAFDPDRFWLHDGASVARRMRALVAPLSRERDPPPMQGW